MNQKGLANIILVAVIVILISAVGYLAFVKKSIPIETTGWKTYRNEQYMFEVKYPPDWSLSTSSDPNQVSFGGGGKLFIDILISEGRAKDYAYESECGRGGAESGCEILSPKEINEITVGEINGFWKLDGNNQMHAYFEREMQNTSITIELYSVKLHDRQLFEKVFATFKFTK